jgi:hypothetical protein
MLNDFYPLIFAIEPVLAEGYDLTHERRAESRIGVIGIINYCP